jgi:L-ascorbate metabolism protein UlaG (beta-lactamase superfamily)
MRITFIAVILFFGTLSLTAQKDILPAKKGDITLTPIFHSTMVLEWNGKTIYIDPYGGAERFSSFPAPDLVLITHKHGDHLNKKTLEKLELTKTELIAPQSVIDDLGEITFAEIHALKNGVSKKWNGVKVKAVPMYNLPETDESRHPKGWGNGYVVKLGGKRLYISGDTEDIMEMRDLKRIDYAFVCMNLPFTMDINQASSAVLDFKPKVVYPFHFRGKGGVFSDVKKFRELVNQGDSVIEVRLRDWYPEK